MPLDASTWEYLETILIFAPLALILLWLARKWGFFSLPTGRTHAKYPLSLTSVIVVFAIYLGTTIGLAAVFAALLETIYGAKEISFFAASLLQLALFGIILLLFTLYCRTLEKTLIRKIWKDWSLPHAKPIAWDFCIGVLTWIISFPLVIVVGQLSDLFLALFFGFQSYEQVAVRYLKDTLSSPEMLAMALAIILGFAPCIEEFLFRGFLQTYFKRFMNVRLAICTSALCFALFHYAPSQGIGNVSLFFSLFTFALFLGWIYERQGSLFASIGLHMTFNAVSTFRILWMPDG